MNKEILEKLIEKITNVLGFGLRESIYQNTLAVELRKKKFKVDLEVNKSVMYEEHDVGTVRLDMIVNDNIILEFKAIKKITNKEIKQIENYIKITKLNVGYIINVGLDSCEVIEIIN